MEKVEILAPAGSMESLVAAINKGADAVYLGGNKFSARAYASNFDNDNMLKAVDYAHSYDVKIYVTLNTILKENEVEEAVRYVGYLYEIGVDALIIQDLGLLKRIKEDFPLMEVHASTQMTIHNGEAAVYFKDKGFHRIVLSREMTLEEIKYISKDLGIETEMFVHGAICVAYSGQCLMSSMIGGRSGNRGRCAQPCRMEYTLKGEKSGETKGHLLSPKDMCTIEDVEDIVETGVYSLKIEGRMKRAEYVAGVVDNYKKAVDKVLYNKKYDEQAGKKIDVNSYSGNESEYLKLINEARCIPVLFNHKARYVNDINYEIYRLLNQGDDASDPKISGIMPYSNRLHCFKDKYFKLVADKPSRTITAHLRMDCHSHIHPYQIRAITPREAARCQSFPDDYLFLGPYLKTYMQIGNAVPCLMAKGIAKVLKKYL